MMSRVVFGIQIGEDAPGLLEHNVNIVFSPVKSDGSRSMGRGMTVWFVEIPGASRQANARSLLRVRNSFRSAATPNFNSRPEEKFFAAAHNLCFGTKRTFRDRVSMSAFGGKADMGWTFQILGLQLIPCPRSQFSYCSRHIVPT
jgi:hypothetical protein